MAKPSGKSTSNPCDVCAVPIMECPWLHKDQPVHGWIAEEVKIKMGINTVKGVQQPVLQDTYKILYCPMFRRMERRAGKPNER